MPYPVDLLVTDLDRTLLRSDGTVSEYAAGIFAECHRRGLITAFATARSERSCTRYIELIGPDAVISDGGAVVRYGEKIIYTAAITVSDADRLFAALSRSPAVGYITAETAYGYYVNKPVDETDLNWAEYLPAIYADMSGGLGMEARKITTEITRAAAAALITDMPSIKMVPFSGEGWCQYYHIDAGKLNGVRALASHTGIDIKKTAAFGDDFSDVEMLGMCGCGVAVANAVREAREAARFTCGTNDEDGVGRWIEEHVL